MTEPHTPESVLLEIQRIRQEIAENEAASRAAYEALSAIQQRREHLARHLSHRRRYLQWLQEGVTWCREHDCEDACEPK